MSMFNTVIGGAGLVVAATVALQSMLPGPPPFVVNSLNYEAGVVTQDRTITTSAPAFYAAWAATVENADTGESLHWCEGNGANAYPPGRRAVEFSLQDWTGNPLCTFASLPSGRYALRASWAWGGQSTAAKSPIFTVDK